MSRSCSWVPRPVSRPRRRPRFLATLGFASAAAALGAAALGATALASGALDAGAFLAAGGLRVCERDLGMTLYLSFPGSLIPRTGG